ncbi:major capsid protein [Ruegeria sp. HKCCD8929]|uniref:major capsid protein n=1 Tax=Ruegeria sp. HKCCD8929 TaxID=2683006 RepID=UPI0020C4F112|nr:major capsid protein [Ruegeria sp. HKCCD8929]
MNTRNMNTAQARVIDPILSTHAQGYRNAEMIGHLILPVADIPTRGVRVLRFGKDSFRKMNTRRAPGAEYQTVQYGYASNPVALQQEALAAKVPWENMEEASKVPGIDLARGSVEMVLDIIALGREFEIAQLVRDPGNYGANNKMVLAGGDKWSDPASDPAADINEGKEQVRRRIGRYPNQLTIGAPTFNVLKQHPKIKEQFKYTSSDSITVEMLAKYFDIEKVIVGKAVYLEDGAADDADAQDVWGTDAILSFRPMGTNYMVPSFGYTYRLKGHPMIMKPYSDDSCDSWVYKIKEEWSPELTGADAGFLFQNPI